MAQITFYTMFVWTVLAFLDQMMERKKERRKEEHFLELSGLPELKSGHEKGTAMLA